MMRHNKVVWSEGLFISPQLFQQQERYMESYIHQRTAPLCPFFWGFHHIDLDNDAKALGKVALASASGIFQDGTPFHTASTAARPEAIVITPEHIGQTLYLAIAMTSDNTEEVIFDARTDSAARYQTAEKDITDICAIRQVPRLVQLGQLRLRIIPEKELTSAWIGLPIAKVSSLHSNGSVELDKHCIPPVLSYAVHPQLVQWLQNIVELTTLRADTLAAQITNVHNRTTNPSEVSDYLLLQMFNRYLPLLNHYLAVQETALPTLYSTLMTFFGEMSTFINTKTRRPNTVPAYQHADPYLSFVKLVEECHRMLNEVLIRSAQRITLESRQHGVNLAVASPAVLQSYSKMVFAVSADMPADTLSQQFIARSKIGPANKLPELIRSHLPGLSLTHLPVPPRQMPFNAGFVYYELGNSGTLWEQIIKYGGLAMHVAGNFPGLRIELWGIHEK